MGQFLFQLGAYFKIFWLMVLGRTLFGMGGENIISLQSVLIEIWFRNNFLSIGSGLMQVANWGGTLIN